MTTDSQRKQQLIARVDQYFAHTLSVEDLLAWARTQSLFADPKALDNQMDWLVGSALALITALADSRYDRPTIEKQLVEARRLLAGEAPFPDDCWPAGLVRK